MLRPPAEIVEKLVYPKFTDDQLTCAPDPDIPMAVLGATQDTDFPSQELWDALIDCKSKLMKVHDLVATWPKTP